MKTSGSGIERDKGTQRQGYLPTLDGWRAVAILWVIENHSQPWTLLGHSTTWLRATGIRGVSLFFALSGLLICTRLLREEQRFGTISLQSFYVRRLFRIQPAALTYLATVALLMALGLIARGWAGLTGATLMVRNFFPVRSGTWETAHFWSLAVEEHFYLFLPGFLILFRRHRLTVLSSLVIFFLIWYRVVYDVPKLQGWSMLWYLRTDVAIGGILLGSVFAVALTKERVLAMAQRRLYPWVALLYTAAVFAFVEYHHSRLEYSLLTSVYPLLLVATMLHPKSLTSRVLEWPTLRFVGRISFSLYLWQQLFFIPYSVPAPHSLRSHAIVCWAATFACAIASYYLVETPLIKVGHRLAKKFDQLQRPAAAMA